MLKSVPGFGKHGQTTLKNNLECTLGGGACSGAGQAWPAEAFNVNRPPQKLQEI